MNNNNYFATNKKGFRKSKKGGAPSPPPPPNKALSHAYVLQSKKPKKRDRKSSLNSIVFPSRKDRVHVRLASKDRARLKIDPHLNAINIIRQIFKQEVLTPLQQEEMSKNSPEWQQTILYAQQLMNQGYEAQSNMNQNIPQYVLDLFKRSCQNFTGVVTVDFNLLTQNYGDFTQLFVDYTIDETVESQILITIQFSVLFKLFASSKVSTVEILGVDRTRNLRNVPLRISNPSKPSPQPRYEEFDNLTLQAMQGQMREIQRTSSVIQSSLNFEQILYCLHESETNINQIIIYTRNALKCRESVNEYAVSFSKIGWDLSYDQKMKAIIIALKFSKSWKTAFDTSSEEEDDDISYDEWSETRDTEQPIGTPTVAPISPSASYWFGMTQINKDGKLRREDLPTPVFSPRVVQPRNQNLEMKQFELDQNQNNANINSNYNPTITPAMNPQNNVFPLTNNQHEQVLLYRSALEDSGEESSDEDSDDESTEVPDFAAKPKAIQTKPLADPTAVKKSRSRHFSKSSKKPTLHRVGSVRSRKGTLMRHNVVKKDDRIIIWLKQVMTRDSVFSLPKMLDDIIESMYRIRVHHGGYLMRENEMYMYEDYQPKYFVIQSGIFDIIQNNQYIGWKLYPGSTFGSDHMLYQTARNVTIQNNTALNNTAQANTDMKGEAIVWVLNLSDYTNINDKYFFTVFGQQFTNLTQTKLNQFWTLTVLGAGTFGRVLLVKSALESDNHAVYSLKKLSKNHIIEQRQIKHIQNERSIMALMSYLNCKFICKLYAKYQDEFYVYLLIEPLLGGELFTILQWNKRFSEEISRFYAACVLLAFEALHSANIIYRDIKPENIMIHRNGFVKLVDFGLSKRRNAGNTFCGTLEYLAPEVLSNDYQGFEVDYWGLGILIYELVTGEPPFKDYEQILTTNAQFPTELIMQEQLSQDLISIVADLLTKNQYQRLGTYLLAQGKNGILDIFNHRWFTNVDPNVFNWQGMRAQTITPPYIPDIKSDEDTSNFDPCEPVSQEEQQVQTTKLFGDVYDWCTNF